MIPFLYKPSPRKGQCTSYKEIHTLQFPFNLHCAHLITHFVCTRFVFITYGCQGLYNIWTNCYHKLSYLLTKNKTLQRTLPWWRLPPVSTVLLKDPCPSDCEHTCAAKRPTLQVQPAISTQRSSVRV